MNFIFSLLKLLTAGQSIGDTVAKLYQQKLTAATNEEKMDLDRQIAELQARAQVQKDSALDTAMRASLAMPFEIFIWKVVVWDNVLGWGTTPPLSTGMVSIMGIVISFYFLTTTKLGK